MYFLFLFFDGALIVVEWGVVGWGRKYYLGPAEIASFSSRDFSQSNKHDTFWHAASSGYFCVLWLWAIAAMDFHSLEIHKKLGLYLSTIIFVSNIIQYEISFLLIYTLRFFFSNLVWMWNTAYIFAYKKAWSAEKNLLYRKNSFFCRLWKVI